MHVLALPPCSSSFASTVGRHPISSPSSAIESQYMLRAAVGISQQSYPSPPMSDNPSPPPRAHRLSQQKQSSAQFSEQQEPQHGEHRDELSPRGAPSSGQPGVEPQQQSLIYEGQRQSPSQVEYQPQPRRSTPGEAQSMEAPATTFMSHYGFSASQAPGFTPVPGGQALIAQPQRAPFQEQLRQVKSVRRNKTHVASACVNCKKAHLSCDVLRPCTRCVASGKEATCFDVQHKKRGRPRLRDTQEGRTQDVAGQHSPVSTSVSSPAVVTQRTAYLRNLRSRRLTGSSSSSQQPASQPSSLAPSPFTEGHSLQPPPPRRDAHSGYAMPMVLLNLDLVILKTNPAFDSLVEAGRDFRGVDLSDLLEPSQTNHLQQLRGDLREERDTREPTYMPPIFSPQEGEMVQAIEEGDLDTITQGYTNRLLNWRFRSLYGRPQDVTARVRLAKTSIFFVSITLPSLLASDFRPQAPPMFLTPSAPRSSRPSSRASRTPTSAEFPFHSAPYSPTNTSEPPSPYSPYYAFQGVTTPLPQPSAASHGAYPFPQMPSTEAPFSPAPWFSTSSTHYQMSARPQSATAELRDPYDPRYVAPTPQQYGPPQYGPQMAQSQASEAEQFTPREQPQGGQQSREEGSQSGRAKRRRVDITDII